MAKVEVTSRWKFYLRIGRRGQSMKNNFPAVHIDAANTITKTLTVVIRSHPF
jgi:hypothetical protein